MKSFIDRQEELGRLQSFGGRHDSGLAVVFGRRRIGKTRLLLEWLRGDDEERGLYWVADQSSAEVHRRYFAEAIARRIQGFGDVVYPDWGALLSRLAREAAASEWRGPLVIDELPYLVSASPELPSILQRWLDHEAAEAKLLVALAGSSQRMMQGVVLAASAPLYGRASVVLDLAPLAPSFVPDAFSGCAPEAIVEEVAAWGGVPWYWKLASEEKGALQRRIDRLVLDPLGPLHREPDRLLVEELPPAMELRPLLDAIGMGAHRVSEIAGRIGQKATSLSRPLNRLIGMRLVAREVPFGEPEKSSRRSVYRISDPFVRLWFKVVAPNRGFLASASAKERVALLLKHWPAHVAEVWEDTCRQTIVGRALPGLKGHSWGRTARWWHGNAAEWDVVAESVEGDRLLLGEAKWQSAPMSGSALQAEAARLERRAAPALGRRFAGHELTRALFVTRAAMGAPRKVGRVQIVTAAELFRR